MTVFLTAHFIELGLMLSVLFLSAFIFRRRVRIGWLLAAAAVIAAGMFAQTSGFRLIPMPDVFRATGWNWWGFLLLGAVSIAVILVMPNGWRRSGVTVRQTGPGVIPALMVSLAVCALITYLATIDVFGAPSLQLDALAFNAFAVGPFEELFFRGVVFALVLEAFGATRIFLRAEMNWGIIPAALVFGFAHFTSTPGGEEIVFNHFLTLWTCIGGLILAWLRLASGSLLMPYGVHVYGNCIHYFL
jgi:membrane protease YdiL (CAAX protease family)